MERAGAFAGARERNYTGGYTILKDWLHPQRSSARTVAVRRFETPPGKQAQVDWGHLGTLECEGQERKLWAFTYTMGYSRRMMAEVVLDQKIGSLGRMKRRFGRWVVFAKRSRYERSSIILTSNKSYGDWGSIFGDPIIATAILDRLLHHSTTVNIRGESYRVKDRRKAGLVPPREQERAADSHSLAAASVAPKTRQKAALGSTASEAKEVHS